MRSPLNGIRRKCNGYSKKSLLLQPASRCCSTIVSARSSSQLRPGALWLWRWLVACAVVEDGSSGVGTDTDHGFMCDLGRAVAMFVTVSCYVVADEGCGHSVQDEYIVFCHVLQFFFFLKLQAHT
jgi:hypothetical protein